MTKRLQPNARKRVDLAAVFSELETTTIHPMQDFAKARLWYGVPSGGALYLVNSSGECLASDNLPQGLALAHTNVSPGRFPPSGIKAFLLGHQVTTLAVLKTLTEYYARFVRFPGPFLSLLLALWTLGTYCYRVFRVYPYLGLRSPTRRCGKSRVLDLLSLVAFNATGRRTHPTLAQLYRGPAWTGGTQLLDEIDGLRSDREVYPALLSVLNSGFERGGVVERYEREGGRFVPQTFEVFAPRALAGLGPLGSTLEDRAILINMARRKSDERIERFNLRRVVPEAAQLRDDLYVWALCHAPDVAEVYDSLDGKELEFLDDRAQDLWEPLLTLAAVADAEAKDPAGRTVAALVELAREVGGVREAVEGEEDHVRLIQALADVVQRLGEWVRPTDLLEALRSQGIAGLGSTKTLADALRPLGLHSRSHRFADNSRGRAYHLAHEQLADLQARYLTPESVDMLTSGAQSQSTGNSTR